MAKKRNYELLPKSKDPSYVRKFGNYPAKKYSKGSPTVTRLSFEFEGPSTKFIDIGMALSAVNRRAVRQGCYFYVNSVEMYDNAPSMVDLHVIPDTWTTRAAYRRAKQIWDDMNDRALDLAPTVLPKYHDFKVYMSERHFDTGSVAPSLYDINADAELCNVDNWIYSNIVSADDDGDSTQEADDFALHMIGDHNGSSDNWDSVGIIRSYADSRSKVHQSTPTFDKTSLMADPLLNSIDYSSEEQMNDVLENLSDDNDSVPYDADVFVGQDVHDHQQVARLSTYEGGGGRVNFAGGFCAPLGLIMVDPENTMASDNRFRIVLNLAVGTYHGVYAERV